MRPCGFCVRLGGGVRISESAPAPDVVCFQYSYLVARCQSVSIHTSRTPWEARDSEAVPRPRVSRTSVTTVASRGRGPPLRSFSVRCHGRRWAWPCPSRPTEEYERAAARRPAARRGRATGKPLGFRSESDESPAFKLGRKTCAPRAHRLGSHRRAT